MKNNRKKLEKERKINKKFGYLKVKSFNRNVSTFRSGETNQWKKLFTNKIEAEFNKVINE